jgi:hypothetical protein
MEFYIGEYGRKDLQHIMRDATERWITKWIRE